MRGRAARLWMVGTVVWLAGYALWYWAWAPDHLGVDHWSHAPHWVQALAYGPPALLALALAGWRWATAKR